MNEVLGKLRVIFCPTFFAESRKILWLDLGMSVSEYLELLRVPADMYTLVFLNDAQIESDDYESTYPKEKDIFIIKTLPGKGGGDSKNPLRTIAFIGLMVFTAGNAGPLGHTLFGLSGQTAYAAGAMVLSFGGSLLINSLIPPATQALQNNTPNYDSPEQIYSVSGIRNQVKPYSKVPVCFGKIKRFPPLAARPYTELIDNDQYLRMIFAIGYEEEPGDLVLSDFKIGNTSLSEFEGVSLEASKSYYEMTDEEKAYWYPFVEEEEVSALIEESAGWLTRTTQTNTTGIRLDIVFPSGLVEYNNSGTKLERTVEFEIGFKKSTDSEWRAFSSSDSPFGAIASMTTARQNHGVVVNGDGIITCIGGDDGTDPLSSVEHYDWRTEEWTAGPSLPVPITRAAVCNYGNTIFVVGGVTTGGTLLSTVYRINFSDAVPSWSLYADFSAYGGRCDSVATYDYIAHESAYGLTIIGGTVAGEVTSQVLKAVGSTVSELSVVSIDGTTVPKLTKARAIGHIGGGAMVVGGLTDAGTISDQIYRYSYNYTDGEINISQTPVFSGLNAPVHSFGLAKKYSSSGDIEFNIIGGVGSSGEVDTVRKYFQWGSSALDDIPETLYNMNAVEYDGKLFVCGGNNGTDVVSDCYRSGIAAMSITSDSINAVRKTISLDSLEAAQYDVRIKRTTEDTESSQISDKMYWSVLRSEQPGNVIEMANLKTVCLKIKGSGQLSGVVDTFNCIVESRLKAWNGSGFSKQKTRNPAWAYLYLLQGPATKNTIADSRIDLDSIKSWGDRCTSKAYSFDYVFEDVNQSVFDCLKIIAAAGRADRCLTGVGKYSVLEDLPQTVPVQMFTPRNSWDFSGTKTFTNIPHALRCKFVNASEGYEYDERIVYRDGYTESNATIFDDMEFKGVTDSDQIYRLARYYLACAVLRPETFTIRADYEAIVCTRGDLVALQHDAMLVGLGAGRIVSVTRSETTGYVTGLKLDNKIDTLAETSYSITVRHDETATFQQFDVEVAADGKNDEFIVTNPIESDETDIGQLAAVGEPESETIKCIVKEIEYDYEDNATLTLVPYNDAVFTADTEPIPEYESNITITPEIIRGEPEKPVIENVRSDEKVLFRSIDGSLEPRAVFTLKRYNSKYNKPEYVQVAFRKHIGRSTARWLNGGSNEPWTTQPPQQCDYKDIEAKGVEGGIYYDFKLRYITKDNLASEWTEYLNYFVEGKTNPPPDVTGLSNSITESGVKLSWNPVEVPDFGWIEIRVGSDWGTADALDSLYKTDYIAGFLSSGTYSWLVKAFDTSGNPSNNVASTSLEVLDPGQPLNFEIETIGIKVVMRWKSNATTFPIEKFKLLRGDDFSSAEELAEVPANFYTYDEPRAGQTTYHVYAVDKAGNTSLHSSFVIDIPASKEYKFYGTQTNDGWSEGTKTNFFEDTDCIVPSLDSSETIAEHFSKVGAETFQDLIDGGFDKLIQPVNFDSSGSTVTANYSWTVDLGAVVPSSLISLSVPKTILDQDIEVVPTISVKENIGDTWEDSTGKYQVFQNNFRYVKLNLDYFATTGRELVNYSGQNITMTVNIRRLYDSGSFSGLGAESTGDNISFNLEFIDVDNIQVTCNSGSGKYIAVAEFEDEPNPTGFKIRVYDITTGNQADADGFWTAEGV